VNPLDSPYLVYLRVLFADRLRRAREEDRSVGASAIEWAIITGLLAFIAIGIGVVIYNKVKAAGNNISVGNGQVQGGP
jgi:Flp pilus assembly pilin Flp